MLSIFWNNFRFDRYSIRRVSAPGNYSTNYVVQTNRIETGTMKYFERIGENNEKEKRQTFHPINKPESPKLSNTKIPVEDPQKGGSGNNNREPKDDKPDKSVEEWTTEEVVEWSSKYIKREYAIKLKEQEIDGKVLLQENAVSLESYGIPVGPASILAAEIEKLKSGIQLDNQNFAWAEPHPLLQTSGCSWDYQESQNLKQILKEELESHYRNWQQKKTDKGLHPLFLVLSGAGTGKSRLLQEFPRLSREAIEYTELAKSLKNAYVFNISFENGTPYTSVHDTNADVTISNRMLYQLFRKNLDFVNVTSKLPRNMTPEEVIKFLSEIEGQNLEEMTVFLLLDGLQKLPHEYGKKDTLFYQVLSTVVKLINRCSAFIIGCCSATMTVPVSDVLSDSSQRRVRLTVPPINGEKIFSQYLPNPILELLVDDMDGHGRALEELEYLWEKYSKTPENYDIATLMTELRHLLLIRYPQYNIDQEAAGYLLPILHAVMTRYSFRSLYDIIPGTKWTVDDACSFGLIRYDKFLKTLSCAYIWIWLLTTPSDESIYGLVSGQYEKIAHIYCGNKSNFPNWTQFELFNAHFRCLKSKLYDGQTIPMSKLHEGAILNGDVQVKVNTLNVTLASKQYPTKSSAHIDSIECESGTFKVSDGKHFFVGIGNFSSVDGWCQICKEPPRRETHQYKLIRDGEITEADFIEERKKAADDDDFFILFSIYKNTLLAKDLPSQSGLVTKNNFKDYYGPFAGRMFYMITANDIFSINKATGKQLQMMPGIGPKRAQQILDKKPFQNLGDCQRRTNIPKSVLELFVFDQK